eukprot:CAMPEP_0175852784 /NCGR_PEP_ID=MMETSP0107_2-20121207/26404_1 /TAXON_ID=195067 ORGANISM="Goniomonas pacifica, Strain CCMP1869" /NCGR_SAMPLE_ID=MMETSP0107_2 /ASSEMBLY_ACC=CAM_ASM_000203 /LENGTH=237 /DNA_ID=CAMNT_0017168355 /DNA_START=132 /DNA_END=845 /DNA_ORIENTATION=-
MTSGVLAAAMSSLDSSINAISSTVVNDGARRVLGWHHETILLRLARVTSLCTGGVMIILALTFRAMPKESMNDAYNTLMSVFGGCMPALAAAAIITRPDATVATKFFFVKLTAANVHVGLGFGVACNVLLTVLALPRWTSTHDAPLVSPYFVSPMCNLAFVVGALVSYWLCWTPPPDNTLTSTSSMASELDADMVDGTELLPVVPAVTSTTTPSVRGKGGYFPVDDTLDDVPVEAQA